MQGSAFNPSGARTIVAWLARACSLGVLAVALSGTMPASAADNSTTQFGPPDSWVRPHFFDQQSTANLPDASADQHWLLVERQINAQQNETFVHSARQVLTADGVQNGSTLTIDFNPGYETLTWHW